MYTETNFKTKKVLKEAFAAGQTIRCYQPGGIFEGVRNGPTAVYGPHYPASHTWYASVVLQDGVIVKIKG